MSTILGSSVEDKLSLIIHDRAPLEAVGLILDGIRVVELPNKSPTPKNSFEVHKSDIIKVLEKEEDLPEIIFWHSHPSGVIGPSKTDMRQKNNFMEYLVITITPDGLIYTRY